MCHIGMMGSKYLIMIGFSGSLVSCSLAFLPVLLLIIHIIFFRTYFLRRSLLLFYYYYYHYRHYKNYHSCYKAHYFLVTMGQNEKMKFENVRKNGFALCMFDHYIS